MPALNAQHCELEKKTNQATYFAYYAKDFVNKIAACAKIIEWVAWQDRRHEVKLKLGLWESS